MKRIISLLLAAAFALSLTTALAPAASAGDGLPPIRPDAEVAVINGDLLGIPSGATAGDIISYFTDEVTIYDRFGAEHSGDDKPGTGWTVNGMAIIVVYGDVNIDAKINARDVIEIMSEIVGDPAHVYPSAADVVPDGTINARDVVALMKYLTGWDVALGERFFKVNEAKLDAPAEDASLDLFFEDSLKKDAHNSENVTDARTFVMKLARNEKESCQIELVSATGHKGLNATITPFTNGKGEVLDSQLLFVDYIKFTNKNNTAGSENGDTVPDALPPVEKDFAIKAGERQGLYVEVSAKEGDAAGLYRATLEITDASGEVIKTAFVYANVWDFTLPVESHIKTAFGMNMNGIRERAYRDDDVSDFGRALYTEYYEYMIDNRVNPWCLPYNPIDERADDWMDDPRVNTFLVAGGYGGDIYNNGACGDAVETETVSAIYDKIKDNESWMKKQLFYMTDEPGIIWPGDEWGGQDKLHQAEGVYNTLQTVFPGARIVIPTAKNFFQDTYQAYYSAARGRELAGGDRWGWGHVDALDVCARYSNIMCPCIDIVSTPAVDRVDTFNYQYTTEHERVYGPLEDRVAAWREAGKEIWWYTANSPHPPMANISQRCTGLQNRVMFWQMYAYDVTGFLYWASTEWGAKKRHTIDIDAGVLVYPGSDYDTTGPVACQRTGIMRDGIEDVEYLYLAREVLGDGYVDALVARIVRTVNDFETDDAVFLAVRDELGSALEAALAH